VRRSGVNCASPAPAKKLSWSYGRRFRRSPWRCAATAIDRSPQNYTGRGVKVNHKRILRLLCEDNLLCLRQRAFVRTTDARHNLMVYPNLARELSLSNINQLWVADITYIRLRREFIYLAVLLDAFSRTLYWSGHLAPH